MDGKHVFYLKSDFLDFHFPSVGEERQISFFPGSHINLGANHLHLNNNSWLSFILRIFLNVCNIQECLISHFLIRTISHMAISILYV